MTIQTLKLVDAAASSPPLLFLQSHFCPFVSFRLLFDYFPSSNNLHGLVIVMISYSVEIYVIVCRRCCCSIFIQLAVRKSWKPKNMICCHLPEPLSPPNLVVAVFLWVQWSHPPLHLLLLIVVVVMVLTVLLYK